jgi:preprotein translocase SecY subunit
VGKIKANMFRRLLLVFTDPELRGKIIKILLLLVAARLLAHIPIPVLRVQDISNTIDNDAVFSLLNTISGGSYGRLSFVMLGVAPYITASIVMQLLTVIIPRLNEIQKEEGQIGQQKINRWTRLLTVPLGALNAWGIIQFLANGNPNGNNIDILPASLKEGDFDSTKFGLWLTIILSMTAGSIIMMWIGEIITEFKMGNGISLLILSGIVVRVPEQFVNLASSTSPVFQSIWSNFILKPDQWGKVFQSQPWQNFLWQSGFFTPIRSLVLFIFVFIITLLLVVFVNDAVRKLIIIYSRRGHSEGNSRTLGNIKADLPIKVNIAGVIPIIFAVSFILFPTIVSRFFITSSLENVKTAATQIETYLSTEQSGVQKPENLPSGLGDLYWTNNIEQYNAAKSYDTTAGQELFGFTASTKGGVQNSFFEGTPLNFIKFDGGNMGFLPEFIIRWNGVLAYFFYYFILIVFFTYFYTANIAFKTDEVAERMQKDGAYIPGYRPGSETQNYLTYVSNRLNVVGSFFLALIALLPIILSTSINFGDSTGTLNGIVGGTTLLILVSVCIETLKQIEAQATAVDYDRFTKY